MTTLKQWQVRHEKWEAEGAQLRQIEHNLFEAEQARDDAQVAFLRELVLLLDKKRCLIITEGLAFHRAQAAGQICTSPLVSRPTWELHLLQLIPVTFLVQHSLLVP